MDSFYFWLSPWDVVFFCQFVKLVIHRSSLFHSWFQLTVDSLAPLRLTPRTKNRIRYSQLIGFYALATQPDNVGESIMYCVVRPPRLSVRPFVRSFVQADLVTTISHKRLEQSRWNLDDSGFRFWRSLVKGQGHSRPSTWGRHPRRHWSVEVNLLVLFSSLSLFFSATVPCVRLSWPALLSFTAHANDEAAEILNERHEWDSS